MRAGWPGHLGGRTERWRLPGLAKERSVKARQLGWKVTGSVVAVLGQGLMSLSEEPGQAHAYPQGTT